MSATIANILIVVAALAIIIAAGAILTVISRMTARPKQRVFKLEISNQGNVSGRYEMKAEDASNQLSFQFSAGGTPLPTTSVPRPGDAPGVALMPVAAPVPAASNPGGQTQGAGGFVSTFADIIGSIGYMLPSQYGGSTLSNLSYSMKQGQYAAGRARDIQSRVGGLAGSQPPTAQAGTPAAAAAPTVAADSWAQTTVVNAGSSLNVELRVTPHSAQVAGQFPFRVVSRMAGQPGAPESAENGTAAFSGVSLLQRVWPIAAFLAVAAGTIACSTFLIVTRALVSGQ